MKIIMLLLIMLNFSTITYSEENTDVEKIVCSTPNELVKNKIEKVLHAREYDPSKFEGLLYQLHSDKSIEATEAIVRLESVYLGSWPSTANGCEIYHRGRQSLSYLKNPAYCLNSIMITEKLLLKFTPQLVFKKKQHISDKINSSYTGWCNFDF
jgi:hypothetical protein